MLTKWFNTEKELEFAQRVVAEINQHFLHNLTPNIPKAKKAKAVKKNAAKLDFLVKITREFTQQNKLNIYKKAKLLNAVKWGLHETGHEKPFIDEIVVLLSHQLR
jgi:hypothetical protein